MVHARKFISHADYFAHASPQAKPLLETIQRRVQVLLPDACPCIHYNMPAFRQGRVFFYFAAFKRHIGIYPPVKHHRQLIRQLEKYRNEKGNLAFPLDHPLPIDLIEQVAIALHQVYTSP